MSRASRGRSQETKGVAESVLRSNERKKHKGIDPKVLLTEAAVREHLEAFLCPFCAAGPFVVVAAHASRMHGIGPSELRELAGIGYTQSILPDSVHQARSASAKERGVNPRKRGGPKGAPRRSSAATLSANKLNYEKRMASMREMPEYSGMSDEEIRRAEGVKAAAAHLRNTQAARDDLDSRVLKLHGEGKEYKVIAEALGIQSNTVARSLRRSGVFEDGRTRRKSL